MKEMTVLEVIKKYNLEDYDKRYFNCYGQRVDLKYSISVLGMKKVKSIDVNFPTKSANVTIIEL